MRCCGAGTALVALSRVQPRMRRGRLRGRPTAGAGSRSPLMGHTSAPPRSNSLWHRSGRVQLISSVN